MLLLLVLSSCRSGSVAATVLQSIAERSSNPPTIIFRGKLFPPSFPLSLSVSYKITPSLASCSLDRSIDRYAASSTVGSLVNIFPRKRRVEYRDFYPTGRNAIMDDLDLSHLSPEEQAEARRMQEIAARAEMKNAQKSSNQLNMGNNGSTLVSNGSNGSTPSARFLTKSEREALALEKLAQKRAEQEQRMREAALHHERFVTGQALEERRREEKERERRAREERERREREENKPSKELDHEVRAIREHYLGNQEKKRKIIKPSEKFARIFKFDWEAEEDTARTDVNPLYTKKVKINALFGRGYIGGLDPSEQRKKSNFMANLGEKRLLETKRLEEKDEGLTEEEKAERARLRDRALGMLRMQQSMDFESEEKMERERVSSHWSTKTLEEMTDRDWRIFREDFDIRIKGGRATLPLRYWREGNFPEAILKAIEDAGYKEPSPIQRQAIPIGQVNQQM